MRKALLVTLVVVALGALALLGLRRGGSPAAGRKVHVYCGTSMTQPAEAIAREFERRRGIFVEFNFGGSETLLPMVKVSGRGDLFITHDPFPEELRQAGLVDSYQTVGYLEPVLAVAKGNPLKITSLADLARPGVRVGLMDARYSTCGQLVQAALEKRGVAAAVRANVKVEKRSHQELASDLAIGSLDAAVVWNFSAALNRDKVDRIPTDDAYPETRVAVCLLKSAADRDGAALFMELAASDFGREAFRRAGYDRQRPAATIHRRDAEHAE